MKALKLEDIASKYHAGYVRRLASRNADIVQTMSFCDGVLHDLRNNNKIIADLGIAMVSPKFGELYCLCDKYGKFMSEDITPQEYSKLLGYSR